MYTASVLGMISALYKELLLLIFFEIVQSCKEVFDNVKYMK